ncbi:uncharacterized protein F4817DRAFT_365622 [Daldinia loculata]|uniref:uncharacterized protein n=1 Tax=Daldinia loculata TaxID=103429 RepID=UPI0020C25090|nr:uncharacterized protein F4817DRAFT_365622 [Daldinia loculata]KAI1646765.1 hypothetical protein F4817DRAFT_365622 [Daldinia loculata]
MDFRVGDFNLPVGGNSEFRMEDFDPQMEDFDDQLGDIDFSMEGMDFQMADNNHQAENMDYLLSNFAYNNPDPGNVSGNQSGRNVRVQQASEGEASVPSSPDSQAFINYFEWTENNLPIGVSFDPNAPAVTPEFLRGWTYRPGQPAERAEDENQVIFVGSRGTGYRSEMVTPGEVAENELAVRRSSRRRIAPRIPFPNKRPEWAMLATDFKTVSTIPNDVSLWCPCCTRILQSSSFRMSSRSYTPMETCMDCRKRQVIPLNGMVICWSSSSDLKGCGRFLPRANFSSFHDYATFTGILCQDCRAFGPGRARFEGRYIERGP